MIEIDWWFACDVIPAMLVYRNNTTFLLCELTSIFMQTMATHFLLFCAPRWRAMQTTYSWPFRVSVTIATLTQSTNQDASFSQWTSIHQNTVLIRTFKREFWVFPLVNAVNLSQFERKDVKYEIIHPPIPVIDFPLDQPRAASVK